MATALLLLICVGVAFHAIKAQQAYDQLPDDYKKGVDMALTQLSSHAGVLHHFRFLRSLDKSDIESGFGGRYLYHHFYLKPTRCAKGSVESDPQRCPFRNDRPLMDCAICYKMLHGLVEENPKPYVHCIQKPRLTEEMKTTRTEHCRKMVYNSGSLILMAVATP